MKFTEKYGLPEAAIMHPPAPADHPLRAIEVEALGEEPEFHGAALNKTLTILKVTRANGTAVLAVWRRSLEEARQYFLGKLVRARDESGQQAISSKDANSDKTPRRIWK